jgi:hypothetical protein
MKLAKCYALLNVVTRDGFKIRGTVFETPLTEALRLGQGIKILATYDEPEAAPPPPPKAGTAAYDEPPVHRQMRRDKIRREE